VGKREHAIDDGDDEDKSGVQALAEKTEQSVSHYCMSHTPAISLSLLDPQHVAETGQTH